MSKILLFLNLLLIISISSFRYHNFQVSKHHTQKYNSIKLHSNSFSFLNISKMDSFSAPKAFRLPSLLSSKTISVLGSLLFPNIAQGIDLQKKTDLFSKGIYNLPSDDFWYPPYLIGKWNTSLTFNKLELTDKFTVEQLSQDNNLPGFSLYSVAFAPDMGKDVSLLKRFVQIDSHPREDHPYNMREIFKAFVPDAEIESAAYSFQKAPDWFHSPANKWTITYHDKTSKGVIDLLSQKRDIQILAGTVETTEFFHQVHKIYDYDIVNSKYFDKPRLVQKSDYAIHWTLGVPASNRDEFISVEDLGKSSLVVGTLDILIYFQPTSDLYLLNPAKPAGVFSYNVTMTRIQDENDNTEYPFIWRNDGPVELDKYFKY